jgi:hypothetical protein
VWRGLGSPIGKTRRASKSTRRWRAAGCKKRTKRPNRAASTPAASLHPRHGSGDHLLLAIGAAARARARAGRAGIRIALNRRGSRVPDARLSRARPAAADSLLARAIRTERYDSHRFRRR